MLELNFLQNKKIFWGVLLVLPFFYLSSCSKKEETASLTPLQERGKIVYQTNCISCHNADPTIAGSLGPDVAGSSLELITARVMKQSYPEGYTPKRSSHLMPLLPYVQKDIPALHAYLNSFSKK